MCHEYDELFERARLAGQLRRESKPADEQKRGAPKSPKPAEPEQGVNERQPVAA